MALTHQDWQTHLMLVDHTANWGVGDDSNSVADSKETKVLAAVFVVQTVTATATVRTRICR